MKPENLLAERAEAENARHAALFIAREEAWDRGDMAEYNRIDLLYVFSGTGTLRQARELTEFDTLN